MEETTRKSSKTNYLKTSNTEMLPVSAYKAKRTVSFKDKDSIQTVYHVESLKKYNSQPQPTGCLKCSLF